MKAVILVFLAGFAAADVIYLGNCENRACNSVGFFDCNDINNGIFVDPCNCACYYECGGAHTELHEACTNDKTLFSPINMRCDDDFTVSCDGALACDLNGENCADHTGPQYTPPPKNYCSDTVASKCTYFGEYVDDEVKCDSMRCFCENIPPTPAVESPCAPGTVWCELAGSTDIWGCVPISGCNSDCYP